MLLSTEDLATIRRYVVYRHRTIIRLSETETGLPSPFIRILNGHPILELSPPCAPPIRVDPEQLSMEGRTLIKFLAEHTPFGYSRDNRVPSACFACSGKGFTYQPCPFCGVRHEKSPLVPKDL